MRRIAGRPRWQGRWCDRVWRFPPGGRAHTRAARTGMARRATRTRRCGLDPQSTAHAEQALAGNRHQAVGIFLLKRSLAKVASWHNATKIRVTSGAHTENCGPRAKILAGSHRAVALGQQAPYHSPRPDGLRAGYWVHSTGSLALSRSSISLSTFWWIVSMMTACGAYSSGVHKRLPLRRVCNCRSIFTVRSVFS